MNKKISTMFASALLMIGAVFSTAEAQVSKTVDLFAPGTAYYYIGLPAAEGAESSAYLKAIEVENTAKGANAGNKYVSLEGATSVDAKAVDEFLFQVETVTGEGLNPQKYFKLKNKKFGTVVFKAGTKLDAITAISLDAIAATDDVDAVKTYVSTIGIPATAVSADKKKAEVKANVGVLFVPFHGTTTANTNELNLVGSTFTVKAATSGTELQFFGVSTEKVVADDLNKTLKNGFIFKAKDVTDNIFAAQTIKAFEVKTSGIKVEEGYTIPVGTYFATAYPKELNDPKQAMTADLFRQCTFISVDPVTNLVASDKDAQKLGKNFDFKEVSGDDFNFYTVGAKEVGYDKTKITQGSQVSVYNACFLVQTNKDNEGKYAVTVKNFRYKKEAAADKKEHGQTEVFVASTKVSNVQVLLTATGDAAFTFTMGDAPIAKPSTLLNDSTASIYNISFLSGEKATSEKGKYLSVGVKKVNAGTSTEGPDTKFSFIAQGTAVAALNTPQYQFVISAIDAEENMVTFRNRETGEEFTCVLFTTAKANEYLVADGGTINFEVANLKADGTVEYATQPVALQETTIRLTAATVNKFAGFANRDANAGYANITFALDDVSSDKLYLSVTDKGTTTTSYTVATATDKASLAGLFEFVKSEKPVIDIRNNYMYNKDGVAVAKLQGDTVAYYTYAVKWIKPEISAEYYLAKDLTLANLPANKTAADMDQFIIRENKDGSISIINNGDLDATTAILACSGSKAVTIDAGTPYMVADAKAIKSFLVSEELGASLEAKDQHVSFELTTGGFVSMNAKYEGVVAIKTAADEDLTFWLDSAESQATLPSFFISRGVKDATKRQYMYYATDSATYYINNPSYKDANGNIKMIFKAGTLVNSDTLATTVNGKAVNVAAIADASGVLGGLNNFKYNIFKADNAEDAYVIRCKENNLYLTSINGLLTLSTKDGAMKVYAEVQDAPTSNGTIDAVATTSVIAKDGAIEVIGAEGKRVVISNILGQVIANTIVTSSNATIAAPAGIVVVAIEGEAAVKAIVK